MKRKHSLLLFIPLIAFVIYFLSSLKSPGTRTPYDEAWQVFGFVITMVLAALNLGNFLSIAMYTKNTKQTEPEVYDRVMKNFRRIIWDELK